MTFAIDMELGATPEAVGLIRHVVADAAQTLGLDQRLTDDLKTVVNEAATNAVRHPYGPEGGPMNFSMTVGEHDLELAVADHGSGLTREPVRPDRGLGLGLMVISALADHAEFATTPGGGTEVRMSFRLRKQLEDTRPGDSVGGQVAGAAASRPPHRQQRTSARSTGSAPAGRRNQGPQARGLDRHRINQARGYLARLRQEGRG